MVKPAQKYHKACAELRYWEDKLRAGYSPFIFEKVKKLRQKVAVLKIEIEGIQTKML